MRAAVCPCHHVAIQSAVSLAGVKDGAITVKVSINGEPSRELDEYTASLLRLEIAADASGQIRDARATARAHLWRSLRESSFWWRVGFLAFAIFILLADVPPRPKPWDALLFLVVVIVVLIEAVVRIGRSVAWSGAVAEHLAPLPPTGTRVQITKNGLTIGPTLTPWHSLRLEAARLRRFYIWTNFARRRCRVDRLTLATLGGPVVLDPIAIVAGQTIVDTIWRRLDLPGDAVFVRPFFGTSN